jgi:hypothetical protein
MLFEIVTMVLWGYSTIFAAAGACISLYLVICHEDARSRIIKPAQLEEAIKLWSELEHYISLLIVIAGLLAFNDSLFLRLIGLPLLLVNFKSHKRGDHKVYFITL